MKSNKIFFVLLLGVAIYSCGKDNDSRITYPSVYRKSGLKPAGDIRLFSSNGEIRDPAVLSRFISLDSATFTYNSESIRAGSYVMNQVHFQDPHNAILTDADIDKPCQVMQEGNRMILSHADTSLNYSFHDEYTRSPSYYISQVKPDIYTENLISSTAGVYQFDYTGRQKFVLDRSGGQVVAPFIFFIQYRPPHWINLYVNNVLQDDFYKYILPGDTIALKEYLLLYDK